MKTTLKALETSLYWQQVVLKQSRDPAQRARCQAAIERLQAQISQALKTAQEAL
jgi:chorismate-pyruvate lyase